MKKQEQVMLHACFKHAPISILYRHIIFAKLENLVTSAKFLKLLTGIPFLVQPLHAFSYEIIIGNPWASSVLSCLFHIEGHCYCMLQFRGVTPPLVLTQLGLGIASSRVITEQSFTRDDNPVFPRSAW